MSVPFLLCRNGTDCKRNGLSVPFFFFFPVPFNAARSNNACAWRLQRERRFKEWVAERLGQLSASRLLRNLSFWDPPSTTAHTSRGCGHAACCRSSPLYCVSCKLDRFVLLMHVALAAISLLYESARYTM